MMHRADFLALGFVVCACHHQAPPARSEAGEHSRASGGAPSGTASHAASQPAARAEAAPLSEASSNQAPSGSKSAPPAGVSVESSSTSRAPWWNTPYPDRFDVKSLKKQQGFISVKGNRFVDESGKPVVFQGLNIADPDKLMRDGHYNRRHFEMAKSFGANIIRVPVHPAAFRGVGRVAYFKLLDQAVQWANELDLYLIVDWHSIGNLHSGLFQHPMYDTNKQETLEFWRSVAFRYQEVPTIAFYELFNEPTLYNGTLGHASWEQWRDLNEEIIDVIYAHDKKVIPLVGGFDWAYDLKPVARAPIRREGIGYVTHPYPQKTTAPFEQNWDKSYGFVAARYPLFATEIGFMRKGERGAHMPVEDDGSYGKRITDYLAKKGASWTAWCFDPDWSPYLISDWNYTPTESGSWFRQVMLERRAADQPPPSVGAPTHQQASQTAQPR